MLLALLLTLPALSQEHHDLAAGGVVFSSAWLSEVGPDRAYSAGLLGCIGGQGFEVEGLWRGGGEGHFCLGDGDVMAMGGAHGGLTLHPGPLLASATLGGGGGFAAIEGAEEPWSAAFLYLKPQAAIGLGLGWFGVELATYADLGLPIVQWQSEPGPMGGPFAYGGLSISLLFGEFWPHEPEREDDEWQELSPPLAIPPASPPPGPLAVPPPADSPPRPLAVPAAEEGEGDEDALDELRQALDDLSAALDAAIGTEAEAAVREALDAAREAVEEAEEALEEGED